MPSYLVYKKQLSVLDADDIELWITVKGNHIPIRKGQSKEDAVKSFLENKGGNSSAKVEKTESKQEEKVDKSNNSGKIYTKTMSKIRNFKAKSDGTYDFETGKPKDYPDGYSVSFHQNEPDDKGNWKSDYGRYSDEDYDKNVSDMVNETGGELNIGYFAGTPEVSVWVKDFKTAVKMAKKHNQHSIWDWKAGDVWINPDYDPKKNPMKQ